MNKISYDPKNWDEVCRLLGAYMDTCLTPEEIEKQKDEVEFLFCSIRKLLEGFVRTIWGEAYRRKALWTEHDPKGNKWVAA